MKQLTCACLLMISSACIAAAGEPVQRFRMNPYHTNIGKIVEVAVNGTVRVAEVANPRFALTRHVTGQPDLTEGYYLGLIAKEFVLSTKDARLVRLQVTDVGR